MRTDRCGLNEVDGYDMFRQAIVERDADAWAECVARYRQLLIAWAKSSRSDWLGEQCGDIADQALARAWSALTPGRFADFPGLPALLAYLRSCVAAVVIDCVRAQNARQRMLQRLDAEPVRTPEQVVIEQSECAELWQVAQDAARSPQEHTILIEHFGLDLPPRAICERHPDLFEDVAIVYQCKRNLLGRLQRNPNVQRLYSEHWAA